MCEEMIVYHAAPTLAGIKTGSLFSCPFSDNNEMMKCVRYWNRELSTTGVQAIPVKQGKCRTLIYVYRKTSLEKTLNRKDTRELLIPLGYTDFSVSSCLCRLIRKLKNNEQFPHEIGIFLGYPVEDVRGFMEHHGKNCKCTGCWKVYGNANQARKTFINYKRCSDDYCRRFAAGSSIKSMTITE